MMKGRSRLARSVRAFVRAWRGEVAVSNDMWSGPDQFDVWFVPDPSTVDEPVGTVRRKERRGVAEFWFVPTAHSVEEPVRRPGG